MLHKIIAAASLLAVSAVQADAATANGTLGAQITITSTCAITGATLDFGSYVSTVTSATGSAVVKVNCTTGATYTMAIGAGANDVSGQKNMKFGTTNLIPYSLTGFSGGGTGTGVDQSVTINGSATIPAGMPAGVYNDTVALTVSY